MLKLPSFDVIAYYFVSLTCDNFNVTSTKQATREAREATPT